MPQQQTVLIQQTKISAKIIPPTVLGKEKPKMESPSKEVVENNSIIKFKSAVTPAPPKERETVKKVTTLPKENESQQ